MKIQHLIWSFVLVWLVNGVAIEIHWEVITNVNNISRMLYRTDQGMEVTYSATSGGLIRHSMSNNQFHIWNSGDGITDQSFSTLTYSEKGLIVLGTMNGTLTFFHPESQQITEEYSLHGNTVVALSAVEDTLWIATKKMIAVYLYNPEKQIFQFRDFFVNFPDSFDYFTDITYFHHRVWVASNKGIFRAPGNFLSNNLKLVDSWEAIHQSAGLPSDLIHTFAVRNDSLFIGTSKGLTITRGDDFTTYSLGLLNRNVTRIFLTRKKVFVKSYHEILQFHTNQFELLFSLPQQLINDFVVDSLGQVWAAISRDGIWNLTGQEKFIFNCPVDNNIGEVLLDRSHNLWLVTDGYKMAAGKGFAVRTSDNIWHNFIYIEDAAWKRVSSAGTIAEDSRGNIWIGSWGGGLVVIDPDFRFYHFNNNKSTGKLWYYSVNQEDTLTVSPPDSVFNFLSPAVGDTQYTVITDIFVDNLNQSIWVLNFNPESHKPLIRHNQSYFNTSSFQKTTWEQIGVPSNIVLQSNTVATITRDIFNNLWVGTGQSGVVGILTKSDGSTEWINYTEKDNLKNNQCLAIASDLDGYIWFGTKSGLNAYLNGKIYDFREDYQPIGLQINYIFVDSENNKWFATDKGLSILKADGSPWDAHSWLHIVPQNSEFFGENIFHSNLPSENVRSVFVDPTNGDVYCGTTSGLAILKSNPFTTPRQSLSSIQAGPQPFRISDKKSNYFYFYNLTSNSQIKILTVSGKLVRTLDKSKPGEILGSVAQWDGRNESGRLVASGVYLYLVSDEAGNSYAGKILVIRE